MISEIMMSFEDQITYLRGVSVRRERGGGGRKDRGSKKKTAGDNVGMS